MNVKVFDLMSGVHATRLLFQHTSREGKCFILRENKNPVFHNDKITKEGSQCLSLILIDSVYRADEN